MKIFAGLFLLLALIPALGQKDLPVIGSISDIKTFKKLYVSTESNESRKLILKALQKAKKLTVVSDPKDADFILEYKELSRQGTFGSGSYEERGEMSAYFYKESKIIAWSETQTYMQSSGISFQRSNETILVKKFLKAFAGK